MDTEGNVVGHDVDTHIHLLQRLGISGAICFQGLALPFTETDIHNVKIYNSWETETNAVT